ncbi:MAG: helix-turn-helix transcriptional regulator [Verrucomicrobia bacterium]|nr:helix-turn-helix transcriptional regulator [Verrucomicrobiota bacterium]
MLVRRQVLHASALVRVGAVRIRQPEPGLGPLEEPAVNVLALPIAGVFTRHDGFRRASVATAAQALLLRAGRPYRLSFPGGVGDDCLTLQFSGEALAAALPEAERGGGFDLARYADGALIPPAAALVRTQLWRDLHRAARRGSATDPLAVEERCLELLGACLAAAQRDSRRLTPHSSPVLTKGIARVQEAIAQEPARRWTLTELASLAGVSPFHFAHVFRRQVGASVHQYVLQSRLETTLPRVLEPEEDLSAIALDAGFASHSHFTARFRAHFGTTPRALRGGIGRTAQMQRKNVIAAASSRR